MASLLPRRVSSQTLPYPHVNLHCAQCEELIGRFRNEWIRLTSSYARSKHRGEHVNTQIGERIQVVPPGPASRSAEGCQMVEVFCRQCSNMVGQYCKAVPDASKQSLVDQYFYKLSRTLLCDRDTNEKVDPIFGFSPDPSVPQRAISMTAQRSSLTPATWRGPPLRQASSTPVSVQAATRSALRSSEVRQIATAMEQDTNEEHDTELASEEDSDLARQSSSHITLLKQHGHRISKHGAQLFEHENRLRDQDTRLIDQDNFLNEQATRITEQQTTILNQKRQINEQKDQIRHVSHQLLTLQQSMNELRSSLLQVVPRSDGQQPPSSESSGLLGQFESMLQAIKATQSTTQELQRLRDENSSLHARLNTITTVMGDEINSEDAALHTVSTVQTIQSLGKRKRNELDAADASSSVVHERPLVRFLDPSQSAMDMDELAADVEAYDCASERIVTASADDAQSKSASTKKQRKGLKNSRTTAQSTQNIPTGDAPRRSGRRSQNRLDRDEQDEEYEPQSSSQEDDETVPRRGSRVTARSARNSRDAVPAENELDVVDHVIGHAETSPQDLRLPSLRMASDVLGMDLTALRRMTSNLDPETVLRDLQAKYANRTVEQSNAIMATYDFAKTLVHGQPVPHPLGKDMSGRLQPTSGTSTPRNTARSQSAERGMSVLIDGILDFAAIPLQGTAQAKTDVSNTAGACEANVEFSEDEFVNELANHDHEASKDIVVPRDGRSMAPEPGHPARSRKARDAVRKTINLDRARHETPDMWISARNKGLAAPKVNRPPPIDTRRERLFAELKELGLEEWLHKDRRSKEYREVVTAARAEARERMRLELLASRGLKPVEQVSVNIPPLRAESSSTALTALHNLPAARVMHDVEMTPGDENASSGAITEKPTNAAGQSQEEDTGTSSSRPGRGLAYSNNISMGESAGRTGDSAGFHENDLVAGPPAKKARKSVTNRKPSRKSDSAVVTVLNTMEAGAGSATNDKPVKRRGRPRKSAPATLEVDQQSTSAVNPGADDVIQSATEITENIADVSAKGVVDHGALEQQRDQGDSSTTAVETQPVQASHSPAPDATDNTSSTVAAPTSSAPEVPAASHDVEPAVEPEVKSDVADGKIAASEAETNKGKAAETTTAVSEKQRLLDEMKHRAEQEEAILAREKLVMEAMELEMGDAMAGDIDMDMDANFGMGVDAGVDVSVI